MEIQELFGDLRAISALIEADLKQNVKQESRMGEDVQ